MDRNLPDRQGATGKEEVQEKGTVCTNDTGQVQNTALREAGDGLWETGQGSVFLRSAIIYLVSTTCGLCAGGWGNRQNYSPTRDTALCT